MRGLGILRGAQRLGSLFVPTRAAGRGLCTAGGEVGKPPVQHNRAPANHYRNPPTLGAAVLGFGAKHGTGGTMPTNAQPTTNGRPDPTNAMGPYHGGVAVVAS